MSGGFRNDVAHRVMVEIIDPPKMQSGREALYDAIAEALGAPLNRRAWHFVHGCPPAMAPVEVAAEADTIRAWIKFAVATTGVQDFGRIVVRMQRIDVSPWGAQENFLPSDCFRDAATVENCLSVLRRVSSELKGSEPGLSDNRELALELDRVQMMLSGKEAAGGE